MTRPTDIQLSVWKGRSGDLDFERPDRWFKGEFCNKLPIDRSILPEDILLGWVPDSKLISSKSKVIAFGSCFAEYFIKLLASLGYNQWQTSVEKHSPCEENLLLSLGQTFENIFVIVQQFRWAFGEFTPKPNLWFTKDKIYFEATEERRVKVRDTLLAADLVVITLGMAEVWFDNIDNEPLWRTMPEKLYDPNRHVFKLSTVEESERALHQLDRLIERYVSHLKVIFTISPIPLLATFRNQSPVTANQVSKSILRVALDAFMSAQRQRDSARYFYFPSYELALTLFNRPFLEDNRHIRPEVASTILEIFKDVYTDFSSDSTRIESRVPNDS